MTPSPPSRRPLSEALRPVLAQLRPWLSPRYVWRRARHNIGPKLLSLAAAVTLWTISTADQRAQVEQSYEVPITIRDSTVTTEKRAANGLQPRTIRVTLTGRPDRLKELKSTNIEAVVDVTDVPEGSFNRPVKVTAPLGTTLTRQSSDRTEGFVDTEVSRTLPVIVSVALPPETGLMRYTVTPEAVQVSGAARVVARVARIVTSPPTLGPGEESEAKLLPLDGGGKYVPEVNLRPSSVTVRRIDTGEVPIKTLAVVLNDPPAGLKVTLADVQPSTVRVIGSPDLLARLRQIDGTVPYKIGSYTVPVRLNLPGGVQALEQVSVRLRVEEKPQP